MENVVDEKKKEGETWTAFFLFYLWTQTLFYLK